jgi:O-Antigen ligase
VSKFKPSRGSVAGPGDVIETRSTKPPRRSPGTSVAAIITAPEPKADRSSVQLSTTESPNPTRQIALRVTLLFLYFRFSYVHEFISSTIHIDTHILIILGTICYLAWFISGGIFAAFQERLAWIWTAFVGCMFLATLTSTWRGGSIPLFLVYIRTIFPLLLLIPAVTSSVDDLKRIINVIGIAGTTTVLFGLVHRDFSGGRMDINTDGSSIQDPNDFAAHILAVLPAIAYLMFAKERPIFVKVFGAGIFGAALLEMMSTGSRGGFVALLVTLVYIVLTGSSKLRLSLMVGLPLLGLMAVPFVPQKSVDRLKSLFISSDADKTASESADARRALLMASLEVTVRKPLLGVGPGQFADYQAGVAAESHQKGMWHETHNGYTQISSECGIPAALLYLSAVYITFKSLRRASKVDIPGLPMVARTLATMAVAFSSSLIFLAQGYRFTMLVIGAITIAVNQVIVRYERAAQ